MTPTRFDEKKVEIYRLSDASDEDIENAISFMLSQLGKSYEIALHKNNSSSNEDWYCSELIWAAFYWQDILLDDDDNDQFGSIVWPSEIRDYDNATLIMHYQYDTTATCLNSTTHQIECNGEITYEYHNYNHQNGYLDKCYICDVLNSQYMISYDISLNCQTNNYKTNYCDSGYYQIYIINVDCSKSYKFITSSESQIQISLYDVNNNLINDDSVSSNEGCTETITQYLNIGTYYLKINYIDINSFGNITLNYRLTWPENYQIYYNRENNVLTYFHENSSGILETEMYFINNYGVGFYNFTLTAAKADGTEVIYPSNALVIKDHMDEATEYKYNVLGFSDLATSDYGINNMYVYLERNGYFYIHLNMPDTEYSSMTLNITKVDSQEIDVSSRTDQKFTETLFTEDVIQEYAKSFTIDQRALFNLTFSTLDTLNHNVTVLLIKKEYNSVTGAYYKIDMIADYLSNTTKVQKYEVDLEEGTYYIGYFGNTYGAEITASLERVLVINDITTQVLVADPSSSHTYGTEVRFNGGEFGGSTITEGFTRHLHFNNIAGVPSVSRYAYTFYSSDSNAASVSQFGTVFAKAVSADTTVTITAVYNNDPSIIFTKSFTIKNDTSTEIIEIVTTQTYSLSNIDDKYSLVLNETNSPYPWIQYYDWEVFVPDQNNNIIVTMDIYGQITASGPGFVTLTGTYLINPRVNIIINLTITE